MVSTTTTTTTTTVTTTTTKRTSLTTKPPTTTLFTTTTTTKLPSTTKTTTVPTTTTIPETTTEPLLTTNSSLNTTFTNTATGDSGDHMPMWAVGCIIAGLCVVIFAVLLTLFIVHRRRKKTPKEVDIPTLPSKEYVDKRTYTSNKGDEFTQVGEQNKALELTPSTPDIQPESPYRNLDELGAPNEKTNPNVEDDGYLKKRRKGVDYLGDGEKKGRKKKIKNKFNKKNKKGKNNKRSDTENIEDASANNSAPDPQYVNRVVSDAGYSHGRPAERNSDPGYSQGRTVVADSSGGYSEAKNAGAVEKGQTDVPPTRKKKGKKERLYENTTGPESRYANMKAVQGETTNGGQNYYNLNQNNEEPSELYENP